MIIILYSLIKVYFIFFICTHLYNSKNKNCVFCFWTNNKKGKALFETTLNIYIFNSFAGKLNIQHFYSFI